MARPLAKSGYQNLLVDLRSLIDRGREEALETITNIRTKTYWQIGQSLHRAKEVPKQGSSTEIIQRLGEDLHLDPSVLYRALQFYRVYPKGLPKGKAAGQLGWTAHLELLPLKDPKEREFYMKQAVAEGWSKNRLRQAIRADFYREGRSSSRRGGKVLLKRPTQGLHTYLAIVEKVVDGDTLLCRIDLGFDVWKSQRIRLRGIDSAPLSSAKGQKARDYVAKVLGKVGFVVLQTYQVDMYYRYVADVFYHLTLQRKEEVFRRGVFLNEEIVRKGHGVLVF